MEKTRMTKMTTRKRKRKVKKRVMKRRVRKSQLVDTLTKNE